MRFQQGSGLALHRSGHRLAVFAIGIEQRLNLETQGFVLAAGLGDKPPLLVPRQVGRIEEDLPDAIPVHGPHEIR